MEPECLSEKFQQNVRTHACTLTNELQRSFLTDLRVQGKPGERFTYTFRRDIYTVELHTAQFTVSYS